MKRRTVALIVIVALVIGLGAGLTVAALQGPEPTTVPAIVLESDAPSTGGSEPSDVGRQGPNKKKVDRQSSDSPGEQSGGALPAPPPPPAPAGDDDEREDGGRDDDGTDRGDG